MCLQKFQLFCGGPYLSHHARKVVPNPCGNMIEPKHPVMKIPPPCGVRSMQLQVLPIGNGFMTTGDGVTRIIHTPKNVFYLRPVSTLGIGREGNPLLGSDSFYGSQHLGSCFVALIPSLAVFLFRDFSEFSGTKSAQRLRQ